MSATTDVKRKEVEQIVKDAQAIIDQYKGGGLPGEKKTQLAAMQAAVQTKRAEIAAEEEEDALKAGFDEADAWLNKPQRKIPHGSNADDETKTALERAGWEFKGGLAYAPTSLEGRTVQGLDGSRQTLGKQPMFSEDVLLSKTIPSDPVQAEFYRTTRHSISDEYKSAYIKFWRELARSGGSEAMAMQKMSPSEQKALSEGTDSAGGFLVPPDTQAEVLARTAQQAVMRRLARVQPTSSDTLRWMMVAPHASLGSVYSSGFVGTWNTETPVFADTDPGFQRLDISIKKVRVATRVSNDLIMDAAFNVLAFLATDGARNMALVEDNAFLNGAGAAYEPMGILNSGATTFDVEGTTSNTISNTTSSSGSAAKIIAGVYVIPDQYVDGSVMVMRRAIEGKVAALVDGNGRPFWPANAGGGFDLPRHAIEGFPIYNSTFMPNDGTDTNKVILAGNIAQAYIIGQRAQITTTVLRERFADTDQTGIILWERVGGATWNVDAIRIGIV